jgi:integrative and conjugative element protein (TIGR02256 family)
MSELLYLNRDASFGVKIKEEMISAIYKICQDSYPNETGGILIGKYSSDLKRALVTFVTGAPADSKSGRTWFHRGTNGLQQLLDDVWENQGAFYLGEWHYHPGGASTPSSHDIHEMKRISKNKAYNCPEPILIIAGNTSPDDWSLGAYVFVGGKKYFSLKLIN